MVCQLFLRWNLFLWPRPLPFGGPLWLSSHATLSLTRGPARIRSTSGSLSAPSRTALYRLSREDGLIPSWNQLSMQTVHSPLNALQSSLQTSPQRCTHCKNHCQRTCEQAHHSENPPSAAVAVVVGLFVLTSWPLHEAHSHIFPESVWSEGWGLLSHLLITSSHLHIFTSSHAIFTSSHLHISSSHLHIFTFSHFLMSSSHLHIFTSHPLIFTSSHFHIFSCHLHIFTSSHHILSSSHPHIFTSSHVIFTSSHLHISSSHLPIFSHIFSHLLMSSSHFHIFTSCSRLAFLPSCPLALLPSCPLALLPSCPLTLSSSSIFSLLRRGAVPTRRSETQPFCTKWSSIGKNCSKIAILEQRAQPFRTTCSIGKNCSKIAILERRAQPFRTKWCSIGKNCNKIAILERRAQLFLHEMRFDRQKLK